MKFREVYFQLYGLEAVKYVIAPGLNFDPNFLLKPPVLNDTGMFIPFQLDLFPDKEGERKMYEYFEYAKRGGISQITGRYCNAMKDNVRIAYVDATNLYGRATSQPLPISDCIWWDAQELAFWNQWEDDPDVSNILHENLLRLCD